MSDIFKNLKSIFVEDEKGSNSGKNEESNKKDNHSKSSNSGPKAAFDFSKIESGPGKTSSKFTKILLKAIEKSNLSGFDYLEFKNGLKSLAKMEMDDKTRFKSAFAMAQTMGATKQKLIDSAKHYQSVLTKEKDHFENAAEQQMQIKVVDKKEEMKVWEQEIRAKETQIAKLQKEMEALTKNVIKVSGTLDSEAKKVKKTKLDFIASFDFIFAQIAKDIENLNKYL